MFILQLFREHSELNNEVTISCRGCADIVIRELLTTNECTMINLLDDVRILKETWRLHTNGTDLQVMPQSMDDPNRGIIRTVKSNL